MGFHIHPTTGGGRKEGVGGSSGAAGCGRGRAINVNNPRDRGYGRRGFFNGEGETKNSLSLFLSQYRRFRLHVQSFHDFTPR